MVRRALTKMGYRVLEASNGPQAIGVALEHADEIDLVLSDFVMPHMGGREMCRRIKEDPDTKGAKTVVMTALYTAVKYRTEAMNAFRVNDYLTKPLDFSQLRAVLQKHLG